MRDYGAVSRRGAMAAIGGVAGVAVLPLDDAVSAAPSGVRATRLRTEWRDAPTGIDTARPRFTWQVEGPDTMRGACQTASRVRLASNPERAARGEGDVWDSGWQAGSRPAMQPDRALPLRSHMPYWWTVMVRDQNGVDRPASPPVRFVTAMLPDDPWGAEWIAARADRARGAHVRGFDRSPAVTGDAAVLPIFRRDVALRGRPRRAIVSIVGLGQHLLTINGAPVARTLLDPGWTDYARTILYTTHDVTDLMGDGVNRLGVMLGNGMYNVERGVGRYTKFVDSYGQPKLLLRLDIVAADGTAQRIVSDAAWDTAPGPILFSSIYGGEDVDGRREQPGWDRPGAGGAGWRPALVVGSPGGVLKAQGVPGIGVAETIAPVTVTEPKPGVYVYDFGRNMSARADVAIRGAAGARVRLSPGETLGADGMVSQRSYNAKPGNAVFFDYILAGRGTERFCPRFSYQGMRYVQVDRTAADDGTLPVMTAMAAQFIHAGLDRVGDFDSSDRLFVATHKLIDQAVRSNAFSVLTDCPHREKLGWLEQTYLNAVTILYNRDAVTLYEKMTRDIADAQAADGMVPGIAPEYVAFLNGDGSDAIWRNSPEWGIAAVLSPWAIFRAYGDATILHAGYPAAVRYLDYLATRAQGEIVDFGMGDWYDIGPKDPGPSQLTSRALTGTAVYHEGLVAMARIAATIGRPASDVALYRRRAAAVAAAFDRRFWDAGRQRYDTGSQTACAMPLAIGLVPAARRAAVLDALVAAVRATGNAVTAGDVGFHYVVRALAENGRNDVLFDMMSVTDRPSYGYQIARGATALAEAWDANPTKSLNHFMLGHGEGWLYGWLGGVRIDFAADGAQAIRVAPEPVGDVRSVAVAYRSVLGPVASSWRRTGGVLRLDVTIPSGPGGVVRVPTPRPDRVMEGRSAAPRAAGVRTARTVADGLELVVAPGRYRFVAPA